MTIVKSCTTLIIWCHAELVSASLPVFLVKENLK